MNSVGFISDLSILQLQLILSDFSRTLGSLMSRRVLCPLMKGGCIVTVVNVRLKIFSFFLFWFQ